MPVRHNTGGEFPPGSGKKWLGVQFNNNDVLVNVYGGKYEDDNGKKRTQRFYGGRFKSMRPALESVIRTLKKKIECGKYSAFEDKWGLKEKLERAQAQIKTYGQQVNSLQEAEGLRRLNITSRKRKNKNRLQSSHPKKHYELKKERYVNGNSGTLSSETPSGLYFNNIATKSEESSQRNFRPRTHQPPVKTYARPASLNLEHLVFDEELKFPAPVSQLQVPPASPQYWADGGDGGASEASSRSCSPFYSPPPTNYGNPQEFGIFKTSLKLVESDEIIPQVRPTLYDDDPIFDSPLESESSDVTMVDDEQYNFNPFCFKCRVQEEPCRQCQTNTFTSPRDIFVFNFHGFPSTNIFNEPDMKKKSSFDFLKNDDEFDEDMMDVEVKTEPIFSYSY